MPMAIIPLNLFVFSKDKELFVFDTRRPQHQLLKTFVILNYDSCDLPIKLLKIIVNR